MKNITKAALLVASGFVCAAFSACFNDSSTDNSIDLDNEQSEKTIVAQMTTINSELTFYSDNTFVLKEEQETALQRAVSSGASESQGTYEGDVTKDKATASLQFTSGQRKGEKATIVVDHGNRQIRLTYEDGSSSDYTIIHVPVSMWRSWNLDSTYVYFYDDQLAMLVIYGSQTACHPFAYTGDAGKDGTLQLVVLDDSNEYKVPKTATIAGSTMTYDGARYINYRTYRWLVTAWFATTEENGKKFFEYMYFYNDGTFMMVATKTDGTVSNGYAGTYTGDTTKDGTAYATIEGYGESLPGTISGNKLTIQHKGFIYDRIL